MTDFGKLSISTCEGLDPFLFSHKDCLQERSPLQSKGLMADRNELDGRRGWCGLVLGNDNNTLVMYAGYDILRMPPCFSCHYI
jgi:hypothetical protein